jgi:hypothetical protein
MSHCVPSWPFLKSAVLFLGLVLPAPGQQPAEMPNGRETRPQLRFVCVSSLAENHEVVIAAKDDKGNWLELGTVGLRPSFITDWLPAQTGELHLALREKETLKSICRFQYPETARRALVVLIADPQRKVYLPNVVDPEKMGFTKGSVLVVNFSSQPGMVLLGTHQLTINSGQREVAKPILENNGMYRMMVAYPDANKKPVPCYDRYIPGNPNSRDMLFLFPDQTLGFKVFSLPMFGELE